MKLVASFRLPLECCPTTNGTIGMHWTVVARLRKQCHQLMLGQYLRQFNRVPPRNANEVSVSLRTPLLRRVVCTRHSSTQPDAHANWSKIPVDVLSRWTKDNPKRLSLIWDDAPKYAEIIERWERAPLKDGFVEIEVFDASE